MKILSLKSHRSDLSTRSTLCISMSRINIQLDYSQNYHGVFVQNSPGTIGNDIRMQNLMLSVLRLRFLKNRVPFFQVRLKDQLMAYVQLIYKAMY